MNNETNILLVSTSIADERVLSKLLADKDTNPRVRVRAAGTAPAFFEALHGEQRLRVIVLDTRIGWSDWRSIVANCVEHRVDALIILLTESEQPAFNENALDTGVVAVYPRNSAGMLALARLVTRLGAADAAFSLRLDPSVVGSGSRETLEEERQKLVYAVSHDLQDPLQLARRYADMLSEDYEGELGEPGAKLLDHLNFNLERTQEMLDELLDYSRLHRSVPKLQSVDLNELFDEVVALYQVTLDDIGAAVKRRHALPTLAVDRGQFFRLFQNLVGNAIKFRAERPLRIAVRAQRVRNEWRVGIKDNGIGIGAAELGRVFDMFERGSAADEVPGTGMGLAICKRIVQNHGGKIWVRSTKGEGSVFIFSVPVHETRSVASDTA